MNGMPRRLSWIASVLVSGMVLALSTRVGYVEGQPGRMSSTATAACIRDPECHRLMVVAHRAKGSERRRTAGRRCAAAWKRASR